MTETAPQAVIDSNPGWKAHVEATQSVPEVTLADLEWADAIIFSVPTRFGNMPAQIKHFFDTTGGLWFQGKLANKAVSAISSAKIHTVEDVKAAVKHQAKRTTTIAGLIKKGS